AGDHRGAACGGGSVGTVRGERDSGSVVDSDGGVSWVDAGELLTDEHGSTTVDDDGERRNDAAISGYQHSFCECAGSDGEGRREQPSFWSKCDVYRSRSRRFGSV